MNFDTELSFEYINNATSSIKILLTGTPEPLEYIEWNNELMVQRDINNFNHNVESVHFCYSEETLFEIINQSAERQEKSIIFDSSANRAFNVSKRFDVWNSYFICSLGNNAYKKQINRNVLQSIIEFESTGEYLIGCCTSAMNTGINLDEDIKNVFILGTPSSVDIRQSVARIRKGKKNRKVRLFIHVPHGNSFNAKLRELRRYIEYIDIGNDAWKEKYGRNALPPFIYYVDKKKSVNAKRKINRLLLAKVISDERYFSTIAQNPTGAYVDFVEKYYPNVPIEWVEDKRVIQNIKYCIESFVGRYLNKKDQELLKNVFREQGIKTKNNTIGLKTIREWLIEHTDYNIESKRVVIEGKACVVWHITKKKVCKKTKKVV